jgi:CRP-like cAMP-binding protein
MAGDSQVRVLNRRTFAMGDVIFSEGAEGTLAFVVQQGRVRIARKLKSGEQATLGFVEPGGIFGEMALIDKSPRMASAIADAHTVCIVITEETVRTKLRATDPMLRTAIIMMIRMIRMVSDKTPLPPDDLKAIARAAEANQKAKPKTENAGDTS